jgi:hypothetical protein
LACGSLLPQSRALRAGKAAARCAPADSHNVAMYKRRWICTIPPMHLSRLPLLAAGLLAACAGDNHVTTQSPREPARYAPPTSAGAEVNRPNRNGGKFAVGRVYLITRLQTADQPRGEWRAQGDTIRENGSEIQFIELGSGKLINFTAPHQITPMDSRTDRASTSGIDSSGTSQAPSPNLYP